MIPWLFAHCYCSSFSMDVMFPLTFLILFVCHMHVAAFSLILVNDIQTVVHAFSWIAHFLRTVYFNRMSTSVCETNPLKSLLYDLNQIANC